MTQILPGPMMRADEQRIEMTAGSGERAGRRAWLPERAGYGVLTELLAFTHALVGEDVGVEENFNEHTMSHLHLSDYVLPVAESQLLRVSRALGSLAPSATERLRALGYARGELVMALVGRAHDDAALMRGIAPGIGATHAHARAPAAPRPPSCLRAHHRASVRPRGCADAVLDSEFNRSIASGEAEAAAVASIAAYESDLRAKQGTAVAAWEKEVSAGVGGGALSLEGLKALVANGAIAFNVNVKYLGSGGRTARLTELRGSLQIASAWHDKCNELLAKPTSPEVLVTLLAEGESIPLKLTEVGELRTRLERMRSWADGAAKVMLGSCELKELQERQREAEVLRIRTPESEALATRTVSHAAKPNAVLGTVSATRPAQHALGDTARSRAAAAPPL